MLQNPKKMSRRIKNKCIFMILNKEWFSAILYGSLYKQNLAKLFATATETKLFLSTLTAYKDSPLDFIDIPRLSTTVNWTLPCKSNPVMVHTSSMFRASNAPITMSYTKHRQLV